MGYVRQAIGALLGLDRIGRDLHRALEAVDGPDDEKQHPSHDQEGDARIQEHPEIERQCVVRLGFGEGGVGSARFACLHGYKPVGEIHPAGEYPKEGSHDVFHQGIYN